MKNLKIKYERVVNEYIKAFSKKQNLEFRFWVCDEVGNVACFGDYFFSFTEIKNDYDHKVKKGLIIKKQEKEVEDSMKKDRIYFKNSK